MKYIIDLDGTIMNGTNANLDSVHFVHELQRNEADFIIMTNSMKSPETIAKRLKAVDIHVSSDLILNPIIAINSFLQSKNYTNAYVVGSRNELDQMNVELIEDNPQIVVLLDFEKENIGYQTLQHVYEFMNQGVPVITASKSPYYKSVNGPKLDTGAFVHMLESVGNKEIEVLGKPSQFYFEAGIKKLNALQNECVVIGDDWSTDIKGALSMGCKSVLIKSGKYKSDDEKKVNSTWVINTFEELLVELGDL